ncbi:ABC transporter substrate-binding protein, partial [Candidatus Nomurabacteria bacterium]|nr:ABC transporter substrate-binding protein [Candidatus Nomurabacteria bacterium]
MTIYLGIDDTDTLESRGTGRLARFIAEELSSDFDIRGVTRHQLYVHDAIPYTSHNSAAVIHIEGEGNGSLQVIFDSAKKMMIEDFIEGSDPGICIAAADQISTPLLQFGMSAKTKIVSQDAARHHAGMDGTRLEGLGGTNDGIIGALAGVGLA